MKPEKWAQRKARERIKETGEGYREALRAEHMRILRQNRKGISALALSWVAIEISGALLLGGLL